MPLFLTHHLSAPQFRALLVAACLIPALAFSPAAQGVVVSTTIENTTAPADDPGFGNVGRVAGSTGVYLGNGWVLTAAHVGTNDIEFPELGLFEAVAGSQIRINNSGPALSEDTDLLLFQLTEEPDLPSLAISQITPLVGSEVVMIGRGRNRDVEPTYWDVSKSTQPWTWIESEIPSDYSGFKTVGSNTIRWGKNRIESDEPYFFEFDSNEIGILEQPNFGDVAVFVTEFDDPDSVNPNSVPAAEFESQAVNNDSGGAVFHKSAEGWELAGIMLAVDGHPDQPQPRFTPIYGNFTFSADLATYRNQILQILEPKVVGDFDGDFDGDGELTVHDLELLGDALFAEQNSIEFDLNGDELVNADDHLIWVEDLANTYYGDSNFDGAFDTGDLIEIFIANQYEDDIDGNSTWATGDWNGDRDFTSADLILAFRQNGFEMGTRDVPFVAPEPTASFWILLSMLVLAFSRRR